MKQETINTFSEGLIKDLNELNTPNNVLTDALNATLITYDGNEFLLQNDLGNGRVETARLPSGYIPVGIKEYGGIIYVASYNPLTGKSQLGSFPSPERQISNEELGRNFSLNEIINTSNAYIRLDVIDDNKKDLYKLNPGDKFIISSLGISKYFSEEYKGILKIHIAIIDKENNVTYIEDDLKEPYIIDTDDISNNTEYQVFVSKTSGYLSIIVELLTIDTFNINKEIKLLSIDSNSSNIFNSNPEFGLTFKGSYTTSSKINAEQFKLETNLSNNPIYSTTSDLKIELSDLRKTDVMDYTITPICNYGELSSFKVSGKIDFGSLGTGFSNLIEWRYYADNDYLKLNWGLDYDVIKFLKVSSVKFTFYDLSKQLEPVKFAALDGINTVNYYKCGEKDNYNGNFSEKIPFLNDRTKFGLNKNTLYFTVIDIDFVNQSGEEIPSKRYFRMVYTNGVFNEQFIKYEILDFKDLEVNYNFTYEVKNTLDYVNFKSQETPNINNILEQSKTSDKIFNSISVLYNAVGNVEIIVTPVQNHINLFGNLNITYRLESEEKNINSGLDIVCKENFDSYTVTENTGYLGNSIDLATELETKVKETYGNTEPYLGTVIKNENLNTFKRIDSKFPYTLNGYVRRGIMAQGTADVDIKAKTWVLTPAISEDGLSLQDYVSASFVGSPNDLSESDTNHIELNGNFLLIPNNDSAISTVAFREDGYLPTYSKEIGGDKPVSAQGALASIAQTNKLGIKCPINFLMSYTATWNNPDDLEDCVIGIPSDKDYRYEKFQAVKSSRGSAEKIRGYKWDALHMVWKSSNSSYAGVNLGGILAWKNTELTSEDNYKDSKYNIDGCTYEFPRPIYNGIFNKKLTILDMLNALLTRLYIPQKRDKIFTTKVPNASSIVYHDSFNENFDVLSKLNLDLNASKLIKYFDGVTDAYLNSTDVIAYIKEKLPQYTDFESSITKNVTVNTNFGKIKQWEEDIHITYETGNAISLDEWSKLYSNLASEATIEIDQNSVYLADSDSNRDGNGRLLDKNTLYIFKNEKWIPYDGKINFGKFGTSNTSPDFFKIERPTNDSDGILYVNPQNPLSLKEGTGGRNQPIVDQLDIKNIIFPGGQLWDPDA